MKNILLVAFFCSSLYPLNAQPWSTGARWVYEQDVFIPAPGTPYLMLTNIGDTLLLGRPCKTLEEAYLVVLPDGSVEKYAGQKHIIWAEGLLMEVFDPFVQAFFPLYDWDKQAGDTLDSYCIFSSQPMRLAVDAVTVTNQGTLPLKVMWAHSIEPGNCYLYGPIVERLGWLSYFFPRPGFIDPPPGGSLICFTDDWLQFPAGTDCREYLVGGNEPLSAQPIELWPNPVRNGRVNWDSDGVLEVRVFDAQGRSVKNAAVSGKSLSIEDCPNGLLFFELRTKYQIIVKKVWKSP
jgi:hypothetical protein